LPDKDRSSWTTAPISDPRIGHFGAKFSVEALAGPEIRAKILVDPWANED